MLSKNKQDKQTSRAVHVLPWEIVSVPAEDAAEPRMLAAQSFVYRLIVALADLRLNLTRSEEQRRAKEAPRAERMQF
jgi:hypothetical protein